MTRSIIKIVFFGLTLLLISVFLFIWFGAYNIAANEKHWGVTTELLEIFRERSIEARSEDLIIPANLSNKDLIAKGINNYSEMCIPCHLSPGINSSELNDGLYPQPPIFHKRNNAEHDPKEMFWVIKNGIKLTGMPAWGSSHTDEQIWEMVSLILVIDKMSADDFKKITVSGNHHNTPAAHKNKSHH